MNTSTIEQKETFVLIHGSWHSAWNWHRVKPLLEGAGHTVYALDLPGMGRDRTPIEEVVFEKTVAMLCELIDCIDQQIILVGHSKNGIMISQVAEHRPEKIKKLIYLAAYLIPHGKTQKEYSLQDTGGWLKGHVDIHPTSNSHTLRKDIYRDGLYHDCDEGIVELAKMILGHEPMESALAPLVLSEANYGRVPRYYIECTQDRAVTPFIQQKMYTETPCKKVYRMDTGHSPFFSKPEELVSIFIEVAHDQS